MRYSPVDAKVELSLNTFAKKRGSLAFAERPQRKKAVNPQGN